ncbi:hypothetical protein [Burkholderia sp. Nafp2/4-1b]|uniref:hypothetical protein n=1 Tax=Burkholderia sp. Nafp2/4-1b TaxID=2116686 RepID=UPI0013CEE2FE|nr:hypothetical protein [Burkholderia sp. Nafp2/4-1b]
MPYLISSGAGIAVGPLHHVVRVQSPALAAQVRDADTVDKTAEATTCSPRK